MSHCAGWQDPAESRSEGGKPHQPNFLSNLVRVRRQKQTGKRMRIETRMIYMTVKEIGQGAAITLAG